MTALYRELQPWFTSSFLDVVQPSDLPELRSALLRHLPQLNLALARKHTDTSSYAVTANSFILAALLVIYIEHHQLLSNLRDSYLYVPFDRDKCTSFFRTAIEATYLQGLNSEVDQCPSLGLWNIYVDLQHVKQENSLTLMNLAVLSRQVWLVNALISAGVPYENRLSCMNNQALTASLSNMSQASRELALIFNINDESIEAQCAFNEMCCSTNDISRSVSDVNLYSLMNRPLFYYLQQEHQLAYYVEHRGLILDPLDVTQQANNIRQNLISYMCHRGHSNALLRGLTDSTKVQQVRQLKTKHDEAAIHILVQRSKLPTDLLRYIMTFV